MKKLAVLISNAGTGTNLQAIIDAIEEKKLDAKISIVVSDTDDAYGLKRAIKHHIPILVINKKDNLISILKDTYSVDFVLLTGWKKIISDSMIDTFPNKILNIHPGLIPDSMTGIVTNPDGTKSLWNKGMLTNIAIENFLNNKATYAGSTVHFLSHEFDFGSVMARCFEKVLSQDNVDALYTRLKNKENKILVESLITLCNS